MHALVCPCVSVCVCVCLCVCAFFWFKSAREACRDHVAQTARLEALCMVMSMGRRPWLRRLVNDNAKVIDVVKEA